MPARKKATPKQATVPKKAATTAKKVVAAPKKAAAAPKKAAAAPKKAAAAPKKAATAPKKAAAAPKKSITKMAGAVPASKLAICKKIHYGSAQAYMETLTPEDLCNLFTTEGLEAIVNHQERKRAAIRQEEESRAQDHRDAVVEWKRYVSALTGQHLSNDAKTLRDIAAKAPKRLQDAKGWLDMRNMKNKTDYENAVLVRSLGAAEDARFGHMRLEDFQREVKTLEQLDKHFRDRMRQSVVFG